MNYELYEPIEVYSRFLEDMSEEDLEKLSISLLGEIKENSPKNLFSSYFPHALSKDPSVSTLARRIAEEKDRRENGWTSPSYESLEAAASDVGWAAVTSEYPSLLSFVKDAFYSETRAIAATSMIGKDIAPEEIERRVRVLLTFSDEEALSRFARHSIPIPYYMDSLEKFDNDCLQHDQMMQHEPGYTKLSFLQKDLPVFLLVVQSYLKHDIDLEKIKMGPGVSLKEAYRRVKERFGEYIEENKIIDPSKKESSEDDSFETNSTISVPEAQDISSHDANDEVVDMFDNIQSIDIQAISERIEENNRRILDLMAQNAELVAALQELAQKEHSNNHTI